MRPAIGLTCHTSASQGSYHTQYGANGSYVGWVERAGGLPLLLPNVDPGLVDAYLDRIDGLLLTGGGDIHPHHYRAEPHKQLGSIDVPRDRFELPLARAALARELPIFGICRGIQTLNVAAGGTLRQDLVSDPIATVQHRIANVGGPLGHHTILIEEDSVLAQLVGATRAVVNSYHHQAVDEVAEGFRATAFATDGTIEAIERDGERFLLGVQWHPEVMEPDDPLTAALFEAFVAACRRGGRR